MENNPNIKYINKPKININKLPYLKKTVKRKIKIRLRDKRRQINQLMANLLIKQRTRKKGNKNYIL